MSGRKLAADAPVQLGWFLGGALQDVSRLKECMFDAANKGLGGVRPSKPLALPPNPRLEPPRLVAAKIASAAAKSLHSADSSPAGTPKSAAGALKSGRSTESPRSSLPGSPTMLAGAARVASGAAISMQDQAKPHRVQGDGGRMR